MLLTSVAGGRIARAVFFGAALFALIMAMLPQPPHLPGEPSDKMQHAIAFATLGFLAAIAFPRASVLRLVLWLSLFGALIEVVQAIPALHRDSDWFDWLVDTIAAVLGVGPVRAWMVLKR